MQSTGTGAADGKTILSRLNYAWEYVLSVGTISVQMQRNTLCIQALVKEDGVDRHLGKECLVLLRTSKQIYKEAAKLFYVCNMFTIAAFDSVSSSGEEGLLDPRLFMAHNHNTDATMPALYEFVEEIGPTNSEAVDDIRFDIGQVVSFDVESDTSAYNVLNSLFGALRAVHTSHPWWKLKATMELFISHGADYTRPCTTLYVKQRVVLSAADSSAGMTTALTELEAKVAQNSERELYDGIDLRKFIAFFKAMRADGVLAAKTMHAGRAFTA
ncbi:hypothetical protein LTR17_017489 [Elasticomyces elasticus]|nr:hypothetical protein LTR17_017489 [Elasticomyces elasticus]